MQISTGSKVIEATAEMLKAIRVLGRGMGLRLGLENGPKAGQ